MSSLVAPSVKTGKFLLRIAWIVEIIAASVGLLFAWLALFPNNVGPEDTNTKVTLIVSAIPFVIVAIVELTKIPLAAACYFTTSRIAKYVFGFSLILVSLITFETFSNGFQQGLHVRLAGWKKIQKQKRQTEIEIKALEKEKATLDGLTLQEIDQSYSEAIINLDKRKKAELDLKEEQIEREENRLGGPQHELMKTELAEMKMELREMTGHYASRIEDAGKRYEEQVLALEDDTKTIKNDLTAQISSINDEMKSKAAEIKNKENQVKEIRDSVTFKNVRLKAIRDDYNDKKKNIEQSIESEKKVIEVRSKQLESDIEKLNMELGEKIEFFNQDLVGKISKKESDLEILRIKRMNLNIKDQIKALDDQEKIDINAMRNKIESKNNKRIEELTNDIKQHYEELNNLKIQKEGLSRKSSSTTIGTQRKFLLDKKTNEIRQLKIEQKEEQEIKNELIEEKQAQLTQIAAKHHIELYPKQEAYDKEVENITKKFDALKEDEEDRKKKSNRDLNRRDNRILEIIPSLAILNKERSDHETRLFDEGEKTFVGRWSIFFFNDMSANHIKIIAIIWFGSLAAITAWLGTVLAFASLVLRYSHEKEHKPSRLSRTIQKFFADARRYKRKPKIKEIIKEVEKIIEVIKEVPVTKIEIKEVPKEVIRKQIVHVPIATDDLTILDFKDSLSNKSKKSGK